MSIDKTSTFSPSPKKIDGHPSLRQKNLNSVPKEYLDVAQGMETQYLNFMLGEMQRGVNQVEPDNNATKYYKSLLDYERAQIMAKTENGVGLKEIILDQIYPQHLRRDLTTNKEAVSAYRQEAESKGAKYE